MALLAICATTVATFAPAPRSSAQEAAAPSPVLLRDARNAGFTPETVRGSLMFCRIAKELGSNFQVKTCYNEDQVKLKIQEYQAERNELDRITKIPTDIQ
jgi:hypothetical protein